MRDMWINSLAQQAGVTRSDDDLLLAAAGDAASAELAEGLLKNIPAHDSTALVDERRRRECTQVRKELAVMGRRQRAGHRQDEPHAVDDSAGAVEGVAIDGPGARRGRGLEGSRLVEHHQQRRPSAQLLTVGDEHGRIRDQHRVGVGGDDVVPVPQHECFIAVVAELLLELAQRGLRARIKTSHDVAGFVLDQAAHRHGDQKLSGPRFGGVDRALSLDGENSLFNLMREEPAISREYGLRQESPGGSSRAARSCCTSAGNFREQCDPHAPRQQHKRIGIVSAQKQGVELGEPFFQLNKTRAVLSRLDLGDEWSGLATERIQIDVVTAAPEPAGAGQGVTFSVNVDTLVEIDDLTFRAIPLLAMLGAAHRMFPLRWSPP